MDALKNPIKWLFVAACLFRMQLDAQPPKLQFDYLSTMHGLSQSSVTCILQDCKGFMWFGTMDGLNKYDANTFTVYQYHQNDSTSISDNKITALFEDSNNNLWIGTRDGLNLYSRKTDRFIRYLHDPEKQNSLSHNYVQAIAEDRKGFLWIGTTGGGLNQFDISDNSFIHYLHDDRDATTISHNQISSLYKDSDGGLWIGYWHGHLDYLKEGDTVFAPVLYQNDHLSTGSIKQITEDAKNRIWVATQGSGLYQINALAEKGFNVNTFSALTKRSKTLASNMILSLCVDTHGFVWIGTENEGLDILNPSNHQINHFEHEENSKGCLSHNSVWSIYEDQSGNMWIGTFAGGINLKGNSHKGIRHFQHYPGYENSLSNNSVTDFVETEDNRIWIATDGGGVNLFDPDSETFLHLTSQNSQLSHDVVLSLFEDSKKHIWIGTWAGGINVYKPESMQMKHYTAQNSGLMADNIDAFFEDDQGRMWVGTFWGGLALFDEKTQTFKTYTSENSGLPDDQVVAIHQDAFGVLWVFCESALVRFDPENETFVNHHYQAHDNGSLSKGNITTFVECRDSTLWIGTTSGLNRFNCEFHNFTKYFVEDGLPNNSIQGLVEDAEGFIWISTNQGISRYDSATNTFTNFTPADGLQGYEFNRGSVYRSKRGCLYFGGKNGFNILYPDRFQKNEQVPDIEITDFQIFNRPVPIGAQNSPLDKHINEMRHLQLSYKHTVITIGYTALNYLSPEKNQFAYMMEGFEDNWNYVGNKRSATYTNLIPGDYVFRVKGCNNDNVWNEAGTKVAISVSPPFWRTWWAYLIYSMGFVGLVIVGFYYFMARERLKTALKLEHIELEKMYEMDQMKSRFFANISHEFRAPLTLILDPLEHLMDSLGHEKQFLKKLQVIQRNASRLLRMTNQFLDFHKIESDTLKLSLSQSDIISFIHNSVDSFSELAHQKKIEMNFQSNVNRRVAWFDADKIDKIIYNLVSNALKFTQEKGAINIIVNIFRAKNEQKSDPLIDMGNEYIEIQVQDNGIGISEVDMPHIFSRFFRSAVDSQDKPSGSGIGLALSNEFIQIYHGSISVESDVGQGSVFTVRLSLDREFLEENQLIQTIHPILSKPYPASRGASVPEILCKETERSGPAEASILIIDDDFELQAYMSDSLSHQYRIKTIGDGQSGYELAIQSIPDLIISDISMPGLDGLTLCQKLKEYQVTSHIPIILLTAHSSKKKKLTGFHFGADDYLEKPFSMEILHARIENLLKLRKEMQAKYSQKVFLEPSQIAISNLDEQFLQKMLELIESQLSNSDLNAGILSQMIGMSRVQLYRKLKSLTNMTVHEFIRDVRLKRAVQLLKNKRLTISEIAYDVGFNDISYFVRCFRKKYNTSPSKYRLE